MLKPLYCYSSGLCGALVTTSYSPVEISTLLR